jgi:hypothetical protein
MAPDLQPDEARQKSLLAPIGGLVVLSTPYPSTSAALERFLSLARSSFTDSTVALAQWLDRLVGPHAGSDPPPPAVAWTLSSQVTAEDAKALPLANGRWVAADQRAILALRRLADALPDARFVVFVENPAMGLASWIEDHEVSIDLVEQRLDAWRRAAYVLLDNLVDLRERMLLVAVEDVVTPAQAADIGARRAGIADDRIGALDVSIARRDAMVQAFSRGWVLHDESELLYARLLAACEPPESNSSADERQASSAAPLPSSDVLTIVRDVSVARHALLREPDLLNAVRARLAPSAASGVNVANAPPTLAEAVHCLHQAREGLAHMGAVLQDNDLLSTFLQQMQEELEYRPQPPAPLSDPKVTCPVSFGAEQLDPPHMQLDYTARCSVQIGGTAEISGRLVEHNGRPGLLIFSDAGAHVFARWIESGNEGGRGFMLLVPEDRSGVPLINGAPASDWTLLMQLTLSIQSALSRDLPMVHAEFWYGVAGRLAGQLASWPAMVRWDRASAAISQDGAYRSVQLDIAGLSFGDRPVRPALLRWRHAAGRASVELIHRQSGERPWLVSWPTGPHGAAIPVWVLPAGNAMAAKERRSAWQQVSPGDRRMLHSLLMALPSITTQACGIDGKPIVLDEAERRALLRLAADARRAMAPPLLRHWARRLAAFWRRR